MSPNFHIFVVVAVVGKQAALVKMRKAVTVVRQMKTLGKVKKLEKAENKLAKLKKKQVRAMAYMAS